MENVDKDIADMLTSLKKYDMLAESVAPVLEKKKKPDADGDGIPDWADKEDNSEDKKDLDEKAKNPYAIGMAAAMKSTGDEPPLKKSTITKAHDIAKKIEADESAEEPDQEVMEWMERFKKLGR